nr:acetolactate synthase 1, chloroplastic-like [Ipomoea batatas]
MSRERANDAMWLTDVLVEALEREGVYLIYRRMVFALLTTGRTPLPGDFIKRSLALKIDPKCPPPSRAGRGVFAAERMTRALTGFSRRLHRRTVRPRRPPTSSSGLDECASRQLSDCRHYPDNVPRRMIGTDALPGNSYRWRCDGFLDYPAAIGAAVGRPDAVGLWNIDGDGSFMNECAGVWLRFGLRIFPVKIYAVELTSTWVRGLDIPGCSCDKEEAILGRDSEDAGTPLAILCWMLLCPHQEHVLPMIPSGGAFKDVITEGDGRSTHIEERQQEEEE